MVIITVAYTAPINPDAAKPILTVPQVWKALQHKVRAGEDFVPAIVKTEVLDEGVKDDGIAFVDREVLFKEGFSPPWAEGKPVREHCKLYEPMRVDFHQPDGSKVSNAISFGSKGATSGDIWMTYLFDWNHPEIKTEDTEKVNAKRTAHENLAKMAVESTISRMRQMAEEGTI